MPITVVEGRRLVLTNLDKILYPATGTRKRELLDYYRRIHSALLPHLRDRPVSFVRYPDGVQGTLFFAKHLPPGTPGWVRTATVPSKTHGTRTHVLVEDLATLMWAGNLGALELHVPQWHAERPAVADRLVLDLDPGDGADVLTCREAAVLLRDRLSADGLTCWAKTSGSKGLHLLVPITGTPSTVVSAYAKAVAEELAAAHPRLLVASMAKARRAGKVFIDWSQNSAAKTTAAPYTVRTREAPTVSTPLTWDELAAARRPRDLAFTIDQVPDRVADLGDLLAPLLNPRRARTLPAPDAPGRARSPQPPTSRQSTQAPPKRAAGRKTAAASDPSPGSLPGPLAVPEPMLASPVEALPAAGSWVYEPKWDGSPDTW